MFFITRSHLGNDSSLAMVQQRPDHWPPARLVTEGMPQRRHQAFFKANDLWIHKMRYLSSSKDSFKAWSDAKRALRNKGETGQCVLQSSPLYLRWTGRRNAGTSFKAWVWGLNNETEERTPARTIPGATAAGEFTPQLLTSTVLPQACPRHQLPRGREQHQQ